MHIICMWHIYVCKYICVCFLSDGITHSLRARYFYRENDNNKNISTYVAMCVRVNAVYVCKYFTHKKFNDCQYCY